MKILNKTLTIKPHTRMKFFRFSSHTYAVLLLPASNQEYITVYSIFYPFTCQFALQWYSDITRTKIHVDAEGMPEFHAVQSELPQSEIKHLYLLVMKYPKWVPRGMFIYTIS